jgi:hypothetical protein
MPCTMRSTHCVGCNGSVGVLSMPHVYYHRTQRGSAALPPTRLVTMSKCKTSCPMSISDEQSTYVRVPGLQGCCSHHQLKQWPC